MLKHTGFGRRLTILFFCALLSQPGSSGISMAAPVSCDTKGWISTIGLEWVAGSCVSREMTDNTVLVYGNNFIQCSGGNVSVYAPYGDSQMTPAALVSYVLSQGYKAFRNKEGTHILMVHPSYKGTIDGKDMTRYAAGQVYTDVFSRGLILPQTPMCRETPPCTSCPCPEIELGSTVNLISGRLSHSQELFTARGGQLPLTLALDYRSMDYGSSVLGSGWSHGYEQYLQFLANGSLSFRQGGISRAYRWYNGVYTAPTGDYSTLVKNSDGSYLLTEKEGLMRSFDSSGRITALVDRTGNRVSFGYADGRLQSVTDPAGRSATFTYDLNGRLATVTDPSGAAYLFTYLGGLLNSLTAPDGGVRNYTYANGMLAGKSDPAGNSTSYAYDAGNRVLSSTDPLKQSRTVTYPGGSGTPGKVPDAFPPEMLIRQLPVMEKNGGGWMYAYNYPSGTVKSITDPYGNVTEYSYDGYGNRLSMTEPGIGATRYAYDGSGNRTSVTDPTGRVTLYTYNGRGQILGSSGPQGTTTNVHDSLGNLLASTDAAGVTTAYEYDGKGNVTKITNAKNQTTILSYTPAGLVAAITDPAGITRSYRYDAAGNMLTSSGPEGSASYLYDVMGRLASVTDPLGQVTGYTHDNSGNRTVLIDANGNSTRYGFNYQGAVTRITDALGAATSLAYGGGGSCPSCGGGVDTLGALTDAKNQTTAYGYDLMSRLVKETDPLGNATLYGYDAAGNLKTRTTPNGVTVTHEYDLLRRLIKKSYPDGSSESYSYDAAGRILSAVTRDISYGYGYDSTGRLTGVTDIRGVTLEYDYDILGNRIKTTLQKGTPEEHIVSYGYDQANRPVTVGSSSGTFTYSYDAGGRRSSISYPHGVTGSYGYDSLGRLTSLRHLAGSATITYADYGSFDKVGNRGSKNTPAGAETYGYDPVYRLIQAATPGGTEKFTYDLVGNRLSGPGPKETKYLYDAGNRMLVGRVFGYLYDNNGNQVGRTLPVVTDKSWVQIWDAENRLIRVEKVKGATEYRTVAFKYDPQGRRIEKKLMSLVNGITKNSSRLYFYDNDNIALEMYTDETGAVKKSWYTHGADIDEHLAVERDGAHYFYHADGLGSVTAITDSGRNVVQSYAYESFGMLRPSTDFMDSYTYTGREWDREAGLYYYRARYYDPRDGRFISKDFNTMSDNAYNYYNKTLYFKIIDSVENAYQYTVNNPINWVDPSGLFRWHGNWGGPGWTAGQHKYESQLTNNDLSVPAIDERDACYKDHDICIWKDTCHIKSCDHKLAMCLRNISPFKANFWLTSQWYFVDAVRESVGFDTFIPAIIHR